MTVGRRVFLGAGVSALVWAALKPALSETPQIAEADGFRLVKAGPVLAKVAPDAAPTNALGYDGATPGPLLRLRIGAELKLRLLNALDEPTTFHWEGLRVANPVAGVGGLTQPPIPPGGHFDYVFKPLDAGLAWYSPHVGARSAGQLARGLFGPIIVDEAEPPAVDLEAIVALQDWRLDAQGQIDQGTPKPGEARLGGKIGANGAAAPLAFSSLRGARVRLRLVNASAARVMIIAIEGLKPMIVAIDGQPSEPFEPLRNQFPMGPGARFELMFDIAGEEGATARFILRGGDAAPIASEPDRPLIIFTASGESAPKRPPLAGLPPNPLLPKEIDLARAQRADITLAGGDGAPVTLNGETLAKPWPEKPLLAVPRHTPVTLGLVNTTSTIQAVRFGGHVGRLLHPLDDGWEPYWRDNILIAPRQKAHIAFVADNPGQWPIESANPDFAAAGFRTFFQVA